MQIYGEITKIEPLDDGTIRVTGVASSGAVDDADETVSPAAMKAALPGYMRFGALREMHGLSAAGATLHAEVGDDGLTRIQTHVVDPTAVKKVKLGVYKGFSIGGKVLERDPADRRVITRIKLDEISLVDRPCNPEAVIDMWKADRDAGLASSPPTNAQVIEQAKRLAAAAGRAGRHTEFVVKARDTLLRGQSTAAGTLDAADDDAAASSDPSAGDQGPDDLAERLDALLADLPPGLASQAVAALAARWGLDDDVEAAKAAGSGSAGPRLHPYDADPVEDLRRAVVGLQARLDKLAAQPWLPKAAAGLARAVGKSEDAVPGAADGPWSAEDFKKYLDALPENQRGQLQLRAALRSPITLGARRA